MSAVGQPRKKRKEKSRALQSPKAFRSAVVSPKQSEKTTDLPTPSKLNMAPLSMTDKEEAKIRKTPRNPVDTKNAHTFMISKKSGQKPEKMVQPVDDYTTAQNQEVANIIQRKKRS